MSFASAQAARLFINATDLSPKLTQVTAGDEREMLDVTTLSDTAKRFISGQGSSTVSANGWLDADANSAALTTLDLQELLGLTTVVSWFPQGTTHGRDALLCANRRAGYEVGSQTNGVVNFSLNLQGDGYAAHGVSLHALGAETIDGNGTSYDRVQPTSTAAGAYAHLHVSAYSGLTNCIFTIEDSANGTDFSVIGTFTTVTASTQERIAIAGTIRRYLRVVWNVTGTGSVTFTAAVAPL